MGEEMFSGANTNSPVSNVLPKARYKVKVIECGQHTSDAGNLCYDLTFDVNGIRLTDCLLPEHDRMSWKWRQFLFAIGVRNQGNFQVPKSRIMGSECLADVSDKPRTFDDGSSRPVNKIYAYSPIEEETAPITGVPSETEQPETPKDETKPEVKEPEKIEDDLEV